MVIKNRANDRKIEEAMLVVQQVGNQSSHFLYDCFELNEGG